MRLVNRITGGMARRGKGPSELMTTQGHKTGQARTTPVSPITVDGIEDLVFPVFRVTPAG